MITYTNAETDPLLDSVTGNVKFWVFGHGAKCDDSGCEAYTNSQKNWCDEDLRPLSEWTKTMVDECRAKCVKQEGLKEGLKNTIESKKSEVNRPKSFNYEDLV